MVCGHAGCASCASSLGKSSPAPARRRRDDRALPVEEAIEARVQTSSRRPGIRLAFHQVAQLLARARVKKIERVIFQRGVNPRRSARARSERSATAALRKSCSRWSDASSSSKSRCRSPARRPPRVVCATKMPNDGQDRRRPASWRRAACVRKRRTPARSGSAGCAHGRSTCAVAPLFRSTGCSQRRLAVDPGFEDEMPAGRFVRRKCPSGSVIVK